MNFDVKLETVLVVDDEPFQTEWLIEYLVAKGLKCEYVTRLADALRMLKETRYRYVVIDLSIPYDPALAELLNRLGPEFIRYPGLAIARAARNNGHNTYQVIVYSVHDSDEVQTYADRIRCRYILKGRPGDLKGHIESTFDKRPHGWHMEATKSNSPATRSNAPHVKKASKHSGTTK